MRKRKTTGPESKPSPKSGPSRRPRKRTPAPEQVIDGRYRVLECLGQGGMACVYRVEDLARPGRELALKLLQSDGGSDRGFQFQREFLCMTRLRHPNIVEVYDFGITAQGAPYFTMEYVPGKSLTELPRTAGFETLYALFAEVLETLAFIHGRGVLHRDLKPQNLLWLEQAGAPHVKLTDFGLAETLHPEGAAPRLGTVLYTPPEVACGMKADQRSDLYSLGAVLYEVLAGRPPFVGEDPVEVLRQHLDAEPPPLEPREGVPAGLGAIVQKLLRKRRGERYSSAEEALQALDELSPGYRPRTTLAAASVLTGDFVGRETEMGRLSEALASARGGSGRTVLVGGEAGSGKSRLLREFRSVCQVVGFNVALVSCQSQTSSPYQPLADLLGQLGLRPEEAPRHGLEPLFQLERQAAPEGQERHSQLVESFIGFLAERSRTAGPLILLLEELHNAPQATLSALRQLCHALEKLPMVVVGTYLHEAVFSSYVWDERSTLARLISELGGLECFSELQLGRLGADEVGAMIGSMLGQSELPEGLLGFAVEEAEGNPFVVEELMKALIAGGALGRGEEGWTLRRERLLELKLPTSVRAIFERRLELCSPEALALAELCSVLGRRVEYAALEELWAGPGPDDSIAAFARAVPDERLPEAVDELLRFEVLVAEDLGGRMYYGLAHNKLREVLYEGIAPEARLELHRRVARYLEKRHAGHPEEAAAELEHHWAQVGDRDQVRAYARLAAQVARRSFAYDRAIESLERCRRTLEEPLEARAVLLEIAELCTLVGRLEKAERLYEEILRAPETALTPGPSPADAGEGNAWAEQRADVLRLLGEIHHRRGSFRQAIERFEEALHEVPAEPPRPVSARCLADLADSFLALGHLDRARDYCRRSLQAAEALGEIGERARALEILGKVCRSQPAYDEARRCFAEALELRQKAADSLGIGNAYAQLGMVADLEREPERAIELFHKALEIFEKLRFLRGQAEVYRSLGLVYHRHKVAWELAQEYYSKSLAILERLGNDYEAGKSCFYLARLCEDRGHFDRAVELYLRDLAIVNQVKDYAAMGMVLLRLGNVCVLRSEPVKAEFYLRQALSKFEKAGAVGQRLQPLLWALRSLCSLDAGELEEAELRIGRALAALPAGAASPQRGYVLLIEAQLRRGQGRLEEADKRLAEGYEILRARGTTFDRAFANLVRGRHSSLLGRDEEALRSLEHAREIFEKIGAKSFLQEVRSRITGIGEKQLASVLGEETEPGDIATLYQISQIFNSTLELKELLDRVLQVVLHQIHAERGYLLLRDEASGEWRTGGAAYQDQRTGQSAEEVAALLASGLVETVVSSGRPVLSSDATNDPRFAGNVPLKLFDVKSILCLPLRAHERLVGVLYLDHRERGRFGDRDLELLRLLATHASRAIENALLYERYRSTMNSLSAGIVALSPHGSVVTCNRYAEELLGGRLAALFGRQEGGSPLGALAARVLQERQSVEERLSLELKPGFQHKLHVRMKPLRDAQDRVLGVLCFLRDLTPVERLKEQLSRESRLSAMGELATKIAGRMKNFFSGIRILAQGLERQLAGDGRAEYVQEILLEVEEAERYVTGHLSPAAGSDAWKATDMGRFLDELLLAMEPELAARRIVLRRDFTPDPPVLTIQPVHLREALVNLCRNAMQALGQDGCIAVLTRRRPLAEGRKSFSIAIQDNGPGIPPEHRSRIFDPFFTTKEDGHGVGLWMVHNVVKEHGGTIELETEVGVGTTFTIHLPL
jgi:PAS domain S-box-containing protein